MVYFNYLVSELRRRRGRTLLTALGLAIGVGLVISVGALSAGLDRAQARVLSPLTGVGTDMSVSRPIAVSNSNGGFRQLSPQERRQLREENGPPRIGFENLKAGSKFKRTTFGSTSQLSFAASEVDRLARLSGVTAAAGSLTLSLTTVSGTVPERPAQQRGGAVGPPQTGGGFNGPRSIHFSSLTVTGVDQTHPDLGPITSGQLTSGRYFGNGAARQAILDVSYAKQHGKKVGDSVRLDGTRFTVVGVVKTPLGGRASDIYVELAQLQKLSGRSGRVNTAYVRAASAGKVTAVSREIRSALPGASVTNAKTLAKQITGSLVNAKNLTGKLGTALELVALLGAILIASLLTLSSVTKRVRELGTLKALGWPQRLVVRQIAGESLVQGLLGGVVGVGIGLGGAALISAFGPALKATVASAAQAVGGPGPGFVPFGQGAVTNSGSTTVPLTAHVSLGLILLAVALAVAGGLVSGAVGGLRASRLRPADALRHID